MNIYKGEGHESAWFIVTEREGQEVTSWFETEGDYLHAMEQLAGEQLVNEAEGKEVEAILDSGLGEYL